MKKGNAKWNPETGKGTYRGNIHHGEVRRGSKFLNTGPSELGQNLAGKKGTEGAKQILRNLYKKK